MSLCWVSGCLFCVVLRSGRLCAVILQCPKRLGLEEKTLTCYCHSLSSSACCLHHHKSQCLSIQSAFQLRHCHSRGQGPSSLQHSDEAQLLHQPVLCLRLGPYHLHPHCSLGSHLSMSVTSCPLHGLGCVLYHNSGVVCKKRATEEARSRF